MISIIFSKKQQYVTIEQLNSNIRTITKKVKKISKSVKGELDDHLDAINLNTEELQTNYDYVYILEKKIEKLNEKLDEIRMALGVRNKFEDVKIKALTKKEKEVFHVIYEIEDNYLTFEEISKRKCMPTSMVRRSVHSMIDKGVPIVKINSSGQELLAINEDFRDVQAKKDVLNIGSIVPKYTQTKLFNY
ncbi:hypothetical protein ACFL1H_05910 [Nanoarchaeota archaeon]